MSKSERACPYCRSTDECRHLLLLVDTTFRVAEGGLLREAWNDQWAKVCDANADDADFDEREAFAELLSDVDSLAGAQLEYEWDGGPRACSGYSAYYVSSLAEGQTALKKFTRPSRS